MNKADFTGINEANKNAKERIELILKNSSDEISSEEYIDIKQLIRTIVKGRKIIFLCAAIALFLSVFVYYVIVDKSIKASAIIQYNHEGIDKGLDPSGKKLDVEKIKQPSVLNEVVKNLELDKKDISSDSLRNYLTITSIIPGDIIEKIKKLEDAKKANVQNMQDFVYYPNQYEITMEIPKKHGVDAKEARLILDEILKQYEKYYYDTYTDRNMLANIVGGFNYEEYDYPEAGIVIENQANLMKDYVESYKKQKDAEKFRASNTGMAFSDISENIEVLKNVDVNRYSALVRSYNLTKDKDKLIKLYEYRIKNYEILRGKKEEEAKKTADMVDKYQKDKTMLYIPGLSTDENGKGKPDEKIFENENKNYDELINKATIAGVESSNAKYDIEYYKGEIERLKNDTVPIEVKKVVEADVIKILDGIKTKMVKWIDITNNTVDEFYNEVISKNFINVKVPAQVKKNLVIMYAVLGGGIVIGLVLGIIFVLSRDYWKNNIMVETTNEREAIKLKDEEEKEDVEAGVV